MEWYVKVLKNYATFSGRARRKEYWMFCLFNVIISAVIGFIGGLINIPMLVNVYSLAVLLPSIAVAVRRMHDVGKEWYFLFIPIYNLILCCTEGEKGSNQFGSDPKGGDDQDLFGDQNSTKNPFSGESNPFSNNNDNNPFRSNS